MQIFMLSMKVQGSWVGLNHPGLMLTSHTNYSITKRVRPISSRQFCTLHNHEILQLQLYWHLVPSITER